MKRKNIEDGYIKISDDLEFYPGFTFEKFKKTKYYKGQEGIRSIYLDGTYVIKNREFYVSFFFIEGKIYCVSLLCDDKKFTMENEPERKLFHDEILKEWGIIQPNKYDWGYITSKYDKRGNCSNILFVYGEIT